MNRRHRLHRLHGFTLVEILIVVAIIGTLAAIAIPNWTNMVSKSRQVEAKEGLNGIFSLERSYFSEHNSYGNIVQIGYVVDGRGRYSFCVGDPNATGSCIEGTVDAIPVGAGSGSPSSGTCPQSVACGGGGQDPGGSGPDSGGLPPGDTGGGNSPVGGGPDDGGGGRAGEGGGTCTSPEGCGGDTGGPGMNVPLPGGTAPVGGNPYVTRSAFEADAYGKISQAKSPHDVDIWSIDHKRKILNVMTGY
jgi:prepilin-type N-terminal cleavage/methylation domain-containing protein